ncbi:MAG TPA: FtsX-like permease family protein [Candidatus Bathyarchaeia archaeon]|nr:FtsX-like permease family protein [Candidatus Bathyarchaeia archaeon]
MGALTRAVRNISRRKMRALLVIVALSFSMAIMVAVPAGITANQQATQSITASYNTTISNMQAEINQTTTLIEVQSSSGRNFEFSMPSGTPSGTPSSGGMPSFGSRTVSYINETVVNDISSIAGIKDLVKYLEASSEETTNETMNGPGGRTFTISRAVYTITGVSLNSSLLGNYSILPTNITEGRSLLENDSWVVILTSNLSDYLGKGVGDKVEVYGEYFEVVGIYEPSGSDSTGTRALYMNVTNAQTITGNTGNVSRLDLYADNASIVSDIADVIKVAYSDLTVTTYADRLSNLETMQERYATSLSSAQSTLSQTQTTATQEIIIAVVATSLIVLFMMLYTVRERTKEIGTFKAIGFSNLNVMSQFLLEGVLLSLMAGVVGIAIGYVAAPTLTSLLLPSGNLFGSSSSGEFRPTGSSVFRFGGTTVTTVTLTPELMSLAFSAAVLLGALGSLYPAWRAAKIKPAEAMRYE